MSIVYRKANYESADELIHIGALYKKIFQADMRDSLAYWYGDNPAGSPYGIVAMDGDRMAGHFGTMSVCALVGGRTKKGRISMGFMVDDDYRGQGVAGKLSEALFSELRIIGEDAFVIGFPNDVSYKMHVERMGYELIRHYRFADFPGGSAKGGFKKLSAGEFAALRTKGDSPLRPHILHGAEFLKWRYSGVKYDKYLSDKRDLFISTRFRDKADILYWTESAQAADVLDFAAFLHGQDGTERVCSWNTYGWLDEYPQEDRRYHMTMNILTDDPAERSALKGDWVFYMGDCELF
ncbi:MAG: GNAT family N-acetyltransferase [Clostridiales bacterium]|nr:GNAT family N-acetyltransferase [Clostridiales bacterium]